MFQIKNNLLACFLQHLPPPKSPLYAIASHKTKLFGPMVASIQIEDSLAAVLRPETAVLAASDALALAASLAAS